MQEERPHWSSSTKLTVSLLLLALGIYLLYRFSVVIGPLILAAVVAFVLSPLANWFENRLSVRRGFASLLAYLVAILILVLIPLVIIPPLTAQSTGLNLDFQRILSQIESLLESRYTIGGYVIDVDTLYRQAFGSLKVVIESFFGQTLGYAIEVITSLVWVVFVFVVSFYLIKDGRKLTAWLEGITPADYKHDFTYLRGEINKIWSAFFRGQLILASVVAVIFTVVGFIIGLPFALAMGVLAGLLEFIPTIGHAIWLITATFLAFFVGSTWIPVPNWVFTLIVIGLHIIYQQFDLNYLLPRIVGRRVQLHPLVVILGVVAGALLAGVLGILIAAPTIATTRVLGHYVFANLNDQDPFPGTMAPELPPPKVRWWEKNTIEETVNPQSEAKKK
ncbi:MAG TPA: AI-2E family transporter [Anaerolineales bacterium]|nr:AI-2E family transporter [Anaerolineales bacterium]